MALKYNFLAINYVNIFLIFGLVQFVFFFSILLRCLIYHMLSDVPCCFCCSWSFTELYILNFWILALPYFGFVNRVNQQHDIFGGLIPYFGSEQYENRLAKGPQEEEIVFLSVIVLSHPLLRWSMLRLSNPVLHDDFHEDQD